MGLFWSNDPATPIGAMIRSIGGEFLDDQVERNQQSLLRNVTGALRTETRAPMS